MLISYNERKFIVDAEIDFIMTQFCYENGLNCYGCHDAIMGDCPCEDISIEELLEFGELQHG